MDRRAGSSSSSSGRNSGALLAVCTLPAWPVGNGYALRVYNLLRGLAGRWDITLVAPPGRVPCVAEHRELTLAGPGLTYPWRFDNAPLREAVLAAARAGRFDRALVWPGAEAVWFRASGLPPAVMDMIDSNPLEFARGAMLGGLKERARSLREFVSAAAYARRTVRSFLATVCVGEQDAAWTRALGGRDLVHVVPNGVALPDEASLAEEAGQPTVSFSGTLDYPPNVVAARYLAAAVWPIVRQALPHARLIIAGRSPEAGVAGLHGRDGVEVLADVPDMAAVISRSWVSAAPMQTGVGIKNKVLEAWACGRPVVMTKLATNGLTLPPGHEGLVQGSAEGLAGAMVSLLRDEVTRRRLGWAARDHVARHFSWEVAADRIHRLLVAG